MKAKFITFVRGLKNGTPPRFQSYLKSLTILLGLVLSVNVWGTDVTFDFKQLATATSGTVDGIGWGTGKTGSASATVCNSTNGLVLYGVSGGGGYFNTTSATSGKITSVTLATTAKKNTPTYTAYGSTDGTNWTTIESGIATGNKTLDVSNASYTYFKIENTTGATAQLGVTSIKITYTTGPSFTITPKSNNDSWGTVELEGSTITATPQSGYRISTTTPYVVTPTGSATVVQDGNEFTVTPTANCTIQINFEEKGCTDHSGTNVKSGTSTSTTYGPVDPYYNYSTRQILYTKTDLGLAAGKKGTIKSIYFEYASSTAMTKKTDVTIYMANTNLTALSKSAYVPYSEFTEVYSGSLNCAQGWNEISLTTPFVYNGSGSLVVLIDDNSGAYESSREFKYHTANTTTGAQIYKRNDSNDEDPSSTDWSSYDATNYRPNTKFCIEEAEMTKATVTWYVNSVSKHSQIDYPGTNCTAPTTPTTSDCDGSKVFVGWTTSQNYESENIAPSDLFADPTTKTIPDGGANYYAVFANEDENITGWQLYKTAPVADDNVVIAGKTSNGSYKMMKVSGTTITATDITLNTNGTINTTASPVADYTWTASSQTVSSSSGIGFKIGNGNPLHINNSEVKTASGYTNGTFEFKANGEGFEMKSNQNNRWLKFTGSTFTYSTSAEVIYFFKNYSKVSYSDYATTCAPVYSISTNNPANGSIQFSTDGTIWSNSIADQQEDADVYFKLVPDAGYEVESVNLTSSIGDMSEYWEKVKDQDYYYLMMPAAAVTVSASFKQPATYMILYDLGNFTDATGDLPDPEEVAPGTNYSVNTTNKLSLTGYTFKGWNTDKDATTGLTNITVNDNITLYAIFTINSYNVTFTPSITGGSIKVNGSSTSPVSVEYNSNVTITVTPTSKYFKLTTLTYNNTGIKDAKKFTMPAENVEIAYSFTEDPKVTVTFKNNGETLTTGGTREVYVNDPIGTLPTLTESCDPKSTTFAGWTAAEAWKGKEGVFNNFVSENTVVTEPKTLNAVWAEEVVVPADTYAKITSMKDLTDANYVFAYDYDGGTQIAMKNESSTANKLDGTALSLSDSKYASPDDAYIWQFKKVIDGDNTYYTIYNADKSKYVKANSTGVSLVDEAFNYIVSWDGTYNCFRFQSSTAQTYYLCGYVSGSTYYFQSSTSGNGTRYHVHLYKQESKNSLTNFMTTCSDDPTIDVAPTELTKFLTIATTGKPSVAQSFTVEGYNLTEGITVYAPEGYEVSQDNSTYSSSLILSAEESKVAKTTLYVRLAAADAAAVREASISVKSAGAQDKSIALSGEVIAKTLSEIKVKTAPNNTTYTLGEKFDPTGLVITATFNSGSENIKYANDAANFTFEPDLNTALTKDNSTITIKWGGKETTQALTLQCAVQWMANNKKWATSTVALNSKATVPEDSPTENDCDKQKSFVGWTADPLEEETDNQPDLFTEESDAISENTTFYAVFATVKIEDDIVVFEDDLDIDGISEVSSRENWQTDKFTQAYGGEGSIRLSSGKNAGKMATNALANLKEDATITFDAKAWSGTENGKVSLSAGTGVTFSISSFTVSSSTDFVQCSTTMTGGKNTTYVTFTGTSGSRIYIKNVKITCPNVQISGYITTCSEPVEEPVFDLAEDTYKTAQELELTCATENSKIYYTINSGEETEYTDKIQLDERGTYEITAYAKVGEKRSSDKVTKTYTLNLPFDNIQAMYAANLADNTEEVGLTLTGAYINKVYSVADNKQIFVQQGNVGAILAMSGDVPEGLADGKALTATVWGTYKINNDRPQLSNFTLVEGYQVAEGTRPTPAVITSLDAEVASTNLLGLVTMTGIYSISKESNNITMNSQADGLGTNYALYNIFSAVKALPEQSLACDVIGLFNVKDGAYSIMPIVAATDFKLQTPKDATLPNIDIVGGATSENPVLVPANQVVTLTAVDGFDAYYKVNGGTEAKFTGAKTVTITEPTSITMRGARDYYTDVTITYYYDIDAAHIVHAVNKPDVGPYTYSADKASAEAGELVTMTITPSEHWNILSVKAEYNDGEADQSITANSIGNNQYTFEMPDYDVKIKVDRKQDPTYTVTYYKGGKTTEGEDPQNSSQFEGDIVTVATNHWTATGYTFEGWKITYTNSESQEVVITPEDGKFVMPAFNVRITATWKKIASYGWKLVESTDDLAAGDKVVIACNTQGAAAGAISSSIMSKVEATFSEGSKYLISDLKDVVILTVGGEAGAWTFADDNSQLLGATAAKKVAWGSGTTTWSISIDNYYNATIQSGTDSYGRFLYNVGSPRFAPYTSDVSASMLLPQLYKRVELAYIVTYVANGGSNPPADSYADTEGNVTITSSQPTWNNTHLFIGWNTDKDGNGEEYIAGQTYTIEDNLKLYAQWKTVTEHSITFVAGEGVTGSVPTMSKKYEGTTFEMPDKGTLVKTDFLFRGWNDGSATYLAGETYTMPGNDVTFNAVWESKADSKWHLVTNEAMLTDGSKIIIAAAGYNQAMGVIETGDSYCQEVAISKIMDVDHYNDQKLIDENEPVILTLMKNTDGSFALKNGTNYLSAQTSGNNIKYSTTIDAMSSWTISIDENAVATIETKGEANSKYIRYNSGNPRFSCYAETSCEPIAIYKEIDGNKAVRTLAANTYTTWCIPQGVEVGNFYGATFWNIADKAYMEDGIRLYSITIEQKEGNLGAGVPYIMLPDAETTEFVYYATGEEESAGTNNGLYGTFVDYAFDENEAEARDAQQLYVISDGTLYLCGTGCGVYANRAYIKSNMITPAAPTGAPRRTIGRPNDTPTTLYGLFGNQAGKAQKALIDGHIYILRDNKMYNAQGLFVK